MYVINLIKYVIKLGESGLGKSTLVNSLFMTDLYSDRVHDNVTGNLLLDFFKKRNFS